MHLSPIDVVRYAVWVLFAGFIIAPNQIPDYWIWLHHLSPFAYALEGLMVNELVGTKYTCAPSETYQINSLTC